MTTSISELYSEIESAIRLLRYAEQTYDRLIENYPEHISHKFNIILYREIVIALDQELQTDAYALCRFISEVLKDHPDLIVNTKKTGTVKPRLG